MILLAIWVVLLVQAVVLAVLCAGLQDIRRGVERAAEIAAEAKHEAHKSREAAQFVTNEFVSHVEKVPCEECRGSGHVTVQVEAPLLVSMREALKKK